jgi:putative tryptophan/tyrosine transport system permease protein
MTMLTTIVGFSLYEGLVFGLVAIAVYLTLRVLAFPDLTVDGSYTLGGAVAAVLIVKGSNPVVAVLVAVALGILAGMVTAILNTKLRVPALLAGILMMVGLYSVNLRIMGGANVSLLREPTIYEQAARLTGLGKGSMELSIVVALVIVAIVFIVFSWFLRTEIGLALRATGDNEMMVRGMGSDTDRNLIMGVAVSNGLVALSGAVVSQAQGFADVGMGIGMIVMGLASVIIGETLFKPRKVAGLLLAVTAGSFIYRLIITIALRLGMAPGDLKLTTSLLVVVAMAVPYFQKRFRGQWIPPATRW